MNLDASLMNRAQYKCELCSGEEGLAIYEIQPKRKLNENSAIIMCSYCDEQMRNLNERLELDVNHWRCLSESMWSEFTPVQVLSYRMLAALKNEDWAQELLSQMVIDDELANWAMAGLPLEEDLNAGPITFDSNNTPLVEGDSVTLIKDLDVKGAGFTAKRGTLVKNIKLTNDPRYIEAKINGIQIVLVAAFLSKV